MPGLSSLFLASATAASVATAAVHDLYWNITYATANPDQLHNKTQAIGVNGTWPPPPIVVNQGDTLTVHAFNGLGSVGTTLHSHGNYFNGSNYYDGAAAVTQCPIPPGETLVYEIPVNDQWGTYWIHGHYDGQYVDGLRAPLIIMPNETTERTDITWDEDFTIIMGDWYHDTSPHLVSSYFLNWVNPTGAEPVPDSVTFYVMNTTSGEYLSSNIAQGVDVSADVNNNAAIPFESGKKYRIRFINMSALAMLHIYIGGHTFDIIEVDAVDIEPYQSTNLTVSVAQRYSILVEALNTTDANYAIMFYQDTNMYDTVPDTLAINNSVTLQYDASLGPADMFNITDDTWPTLDDTRFVPLQAKASAEADVSYELGAYFDTFDDGTNRAAFNNITYVMPTTPSLFTQLSMGTDAWDTRIYGQQTHALMMPHLEMIELVIVNWDTGFHPFHLHGHEFQIMAKSFDVTSNDTSINPPVLENQSNPARRDTLMVPPGGSVHIRFRADNPGAWIFHCHIDWHMDSGLAVIMITDPSYSQLRLEIPQTMKDHCEYWGHSATGNVVGLNSTTDFKGEAVGPLPLVMGWTPKAKGALAGCIIAALAGFASVVWYGAEHLDEKDVEAEIRRKAEIKAASGGKFGMIKKMVKKQ
ncbi:ferroxidase [Cryptococcus gattii Ru294]|nr:ferroxidase [Cryptococcus gattii Ru294]